MTPLKIRIEPSLNARGYHATEIHCFDLRESERQLLRAEISRRIAAARGVVAAKRPPLAAPPAPRTPSVMPTPSAPPIKRCECSRPATVLFRGKLICETCQRIERLIYGKTARNAVPLGRHPERKSK
jgi:hypothetical protein